MEEDKQRIGAGGKRTALLHLGRRLREARRHSRRTQIDVAQELGTSPQTVRNWEAGRHEPPPSAIKALVDCYGMSEEDLLEGLDTAIVPKAPGLRYNLVVVEPQKLSDARREARLTQAEVADLTGLSLSAIRRYEYGSANPETGTLDTLASIYDKPAGWFTPRGHFTVKERYQFQQSVRPRAADSRNGDVVIETYDKTREHLSQEAVLRIARFIEFTVRLEVRARTSRPFLGFNREPWRP